MRPHRPSLAIVLAGLLAACSPPPPADGGADAVDPPADAPATDVPTSDAPATDVTAADAADAAVDVELANGCPVLRAPQGMPGDQPMGDTYADFAAPLFAMVCTRCHSSTLGAGMRGGAPMGYDWDQEASVRAHLAEIRNAVGVVNYMPLNPPPGLTCEQRRRLVRWIDIGAP